MPDSVRDTREGEFPLRDIEVMRKDLGFRDQAEMTAWLDGPRFGRFFEEYAKAWIYPEQTKIRQTGGARPRGPNLSTVEERLIAGERPGQDKYSFSQDTEGWDHTDYLAKLLLDIRRANTKSVQGVFYKKSFSEAEINHRIWILIKHQEYACAPSRRKQKPTTKPSAVDPDAPVDTKAPVDLNTPVVPKASVAFIPPSPNDPNYVDLTGSTPPPGEPPALPVDDSVAPHLLVDEADALPLTNVKKMMTECDATTMDLDYRFWQAALIDKIIKHTSQPDTFWEAIDTAKRLDLMMDREEAVGWYREVMLNFQQDTIAMDPFTDQSAVEFDRQQQFFDNVAFQREDTEDACKLLKIPWHGENDTIFRMPGMSLATQLTFWQPVAIKFIIDATLNDNLRGCVLADVMGLGKTWVTIGLLLWVSASVKDFILTT